jgi:uncharacterized membrane protein
MYWTQFYHLRYSLRSSLWTIPIIAIPFAMFATRLAHWLDARIQWGFLGFGVKGAEALLQATATATLSFLVFTFGSLLVALQVASGQLTPRIIATTLLRNNVVRYTVGLFIFTFLFTLGVQNRLESKVYQLPLIIAAVLSLLCFAAFLYLIDYAARLLRPISILTQVGNVGLKVIESVYPQPSLGPGEPPSQRQKLGPPDRVIYHRGTSGIILVANVETLRTAERLGRSNLFPKWAILLPWMSHYSTFTTARAPSTTKRCVPRSRLGPSGPWSKIQHSHFV